MKKRKNYRRNILNLDTAIACRSVQKNLRKETKPKNYKQNVK